MTPLSVGQCATLACLLEVAPPKVGNVHRSADFDDLTFLDFAAAAVLIAPALEAAQVTGVGPAVLAAVRATRERIPSNVNLGICLLLAPLAAAPRAQPLRAGVAGVLAVLSPRDAADVYAAINLAQPGGLGSAPEHDVAHAPPADLLVAMRAAADRDLIARQYATGFALVFELADRLAELGGQGLALSDAVVRVQLESLAAHGDSLIGRKAGASAERETRARAAAALEALAEEGEEAYLDALSDLDFWLRSAGRQRNPGATADLLAAALFVLLRDERCPGRWR